LPLASDTKTLPAPAPGVTCTTLAFTVSAFTFPITSSFSVGVFVPTPTLLCADTKFALTANSTIATILKSEFCVIKDFFVNF
jgi:hypothetical protein